MFVINSTPHGSIYPNLDFLDPVTEKNGDEWSIQIQGRICPCNIWMMVQTPSLCFSIFYGSQTHRCTTLPSGMSPNGRTCFWNIKNALMKETQKRQKNNKRNAYKRKREKTNTETNIKRGAELRELWCQFSADGIISAACSLVKEALMQTYTDSSELLKEGHKKVMCVSHCELVKTKPRSIRGILGRLLE